MTTDAKPLHVADAVPAALPDGFQVQIDLHCARDGDLRYLVGGSPTRLIRLSDAALGMTSADGRIEVCDAPTRQLARRLLDSGIAHPRPMSGPSTDSVTIVVPVRDNQSGVDRLLRAVAGTRVIVVDDGSAQPITVTGEGVVVIRLDDNRGPAAARNVGAAAATTEFIAFLDSDVVPRPDWLVMLLAHFSDPQVAAVAPRIIGLSRSALAGATWSSRRRSIAERYENGYSSLDMGPAEAAVAPGTRIPYVPSAAIVLRRSAFSGFDESTRVAEDVDLCWRLHEAGWRIRYDPVAAVAHDHRTGIRKVLDRRRFYGTGAAFLAKRHGTQAAPAVMTVSMAVALAALLTRTRIGAVIALIVLGRMSLRLRGRLGELPQAFWVSAQMTTRATFFGIMQVAGAVCRHYWPLTVLLSVISPRFRRLVIELAVAEGLVEWVRRVVAEPSVMPTLGPLSFLLLRRLDDLAYGAGLWQGVIGHRDLTALRPVLIP
ncbi:MAG: mycofactocin biosynthesis glycosyltransferase MftF [Gordonia sp. (in: high G+C Gram-positive bacteria)]